MCLLSGVESGSKPERVAVMNIKLKWGDFTIILVVFLFAAGLGLRLWIPRTEGGLYAEIWLEGKLTERVLLNDGMHRTISVGDNNTIELEGMTAKIASANCRDQVCVHTGTLTRAGQTAVCLPNRVVLRLTGGESGVDAVVS